MTSIGFGIDVIDDERVVALKFQKVIALSEIPLVGQHNIANAMAAIALVHALDVPLNGALDGLRHYESLPHRMRKCGEMDGVIYVNDSKGTNEGASVAALQGMLASVSGQVWMLVGGDGKGSDFERLAAAAQDPRARLIGFGRDGQKIIQRCQGEQVVETLDQALALAQQSATEGDAIVLSPACASFDQFASFTARGEYFESLVRSALYESRCAPGGQPAQMPDPMLFWGCVALSLLGLVMVGSASIEYAEVKQGSPWHYQIRHGIYWFMAAGAGVFAALFPPSWFSNTAKSFGVGCAVVAGGVCAWPG